MLVDLRRSEFDVILTISHEHLRDVVLVLNIALQ